MTTAAPRKQPSIRELLAYPRATMSEAYARWLDRVPTQGLKPQPTGLSPRQREIAARCNDWVAELIDRLDERDAIRAADRMAQVPPSILIPVTKASAPRETRENTPDIDSTVQTVEQRLERFGPARKRAAEMSAFARSLVQDQWAAVGADARQIADELDSCGRFLVFHEYPHGENRLHAAKLCHRHLLCPLCAIRRGAKMNRAYAPIIAAMVREHGLRPYLGTWTIANGPDLLERFEHLVSSWRSQINARRRFRHWIEGKCLKRQPRTELGFVEGMAYAIEIKRGRGSGGWHPHIHAVLLAKNPPDVLALRRQWHDQTGDSHMVDLRPFHCTDAIATADPADVPELLAGDLVEVLKYAVKFSSMQLSDTWLAFSVLRGRRLIGKVGNLRGVDVPRDLLDAPLDADDLPFVEAIARYQQGGTYTVERSQLQQPFNHREPCDVPF
ncbi:MAG: protein rep [Planctomycetota bacterium]